MTFVRKLWRFGRDVLPVDGFHFERPLVLLQSDDWGRAGQRDQEGVEQLRSAGLVLSEHPYDSYTLEKAEDLASLSAAMKLHRDSSGRHPCVEMNFILANLDLAKMSTDGFRQIHLRPLTEGLPPGWVRPGLMEAYRDGIADGVFQPAMHGNTHFCQRAIKHHLRDSGERGSLLRALWKAGTPYIHWRMPWIGYEYWDSEGWGDRFLPASQQSELIGQAVGIFSQMFSSLPYSACAPGYRANENTFSAWARHGIRVAQNGPVPVTPPPYLDRTGVLQLHRTVDFEPAVDPAFSVESSLSQAEQCFRRRIPAIVSVHSINFHSSLRDFRSRTLSLLDDFLSALEAKHPDLLYLHDGDICELVHKGSYETKQGSVCVKVTKKRFTVPGLDNEGDIDESTEVGSAGNSGLPAG